MESKKKRGRPAVENKADKQMPGVRLTEGQLMSYRNAAEAEGLALATWIKKHLDRVAKRING